MEPTKVARTAWVLLSVRARDGKNKKPRTHNDHYKANYCGPSIVHHRSSSTSSINLTGPKFTGQSIASP
jgi:hypothetical protein